MENSISSIMLRRDYSLLLKSTTIIFSSLLSFADCSAGHNEKALLHDLLDSYNTLERPVVNESDPLQLSFGLTLMQIIDVVSCPCGPNVKQKRREKITGNNQSRITVLYASVPINQSKCPDIFITSIISRHINVVNCSHYCTLLNALLFTCCRTRRISCS